MCFPCLSFQLYMTQPLRMRCTRDFHDMLENRMSTSKNIVLVCKCELYNIFLGRTAYKYLR